MYTLPGADMGDPTAGPTEAPAAPTQAPAAPTEAPAPTLQCLKCETVPSGYCPYTDFNAGEVGTQQCNDGEKCAVCMICDT